MLGSRQAGDAGVLAVPPLHAAMSWSITCTHPHNAKLNQAPQFVHLQEADMQLQLQHQKNYHSSSCCGETGYQSIDGAARKELR